jgi:hypothetical protein
MPYIQIKISENVAALLEEARVTGSGLEFKSTIHGLDLQIEPGVRPTLSGSFSNFKVVAEPQIVIEERTGTEPALPPQAEPSNVISIKLPHSKEVAIENRRNLLVACLQRGYKPGMTQAEIKQLLLQDCGVECSTTTVNQDLNELKKRGTITSYSERGLGTVYKVVLPPIEALGF